MTVHRTRAGTRMPALTALLCTATLLAGGALFAAPPPLADVNVLGPATAPVNVVIFSDFECPYCARSAAPLRDLAAKYPAEVRLVFRNFPLSIHSRAPLAHQAALAAGEQGKFWEMHDLLFADQGHLSRADFSARAAKLGLDMAKFDEALDSGRYKPLVDQDVAEGKALGLNSTPTFYVNGKVLVGAQTGDSLNRAIDVALGRATEGDGTPAPPPLPLGIESPVTINTDGAPSLGPDSAVVTIVAFSDFQCPFCGKSQQTLRELRDAYPDTVRIVFKHFPLSIHDDAMLAHQASLAAAQQGRFWQMHDILFTNQRTLKRPDLSRLAGEAGLDVPVFDAALNSGIFRSRVESDVTEGSALGVDGTPMFYVNGHRVAGAAPFAEFDNIIRKELLRPEVSAAGAQRDKAQASNSLAHGQSNAPVTLVWFSDLTSPYSGKALGIVKDLEQKYAGQLRVIFRNAPLLALRPEAMTVHEAAMEAASSGQFWEMQDRIAAKNGAVSRQDLLDFGQSLGIASDKMAAAIDGGAHKEQIEADLAEVRRRDIRGTPVFFINGKRVDGIQPLDLFTEYIDAELKPVLAEAK